MSEFEKRRVDIPLRDIGGGVMGFYATDHPDGLIVCDEAWAIERDLPTLGPGTAFQRDTYAKHHGVERLISRQLYQDQWVDRDVLDA